jgi:PKD repeat protein
VWVGTNSALYELGPNGGVVQEINEHDGGYKGIAGTSTALYGPDSDGNLTVILGGGNAPSFVISPPVPIVGETTTFDGSPTEGEVESYSWTFGDGTTASGQTVTHTYGSTGTYEVTLTVDRPDGTETTTRTVDIGEQDDNGDSGITAAFDYSPQQLGPGGEVTLDATASTGEGIDEYLWDFGDDTTADGVETTHTYENPGEYAITLEVLAVPQGTTREVEDGQLVAPDGPAESGTTDNDPVVVDTATATVLVEASDDIGFTISELEPVTNKPVQFESGLDVADNPEWEFGDGTTATGPAASHQYDDTGEYTVTLSGDGETATRTLSVEKPPVEIETVDRKIDGTLLPSLGLDERFETSVTTPPDRELSHVEFAFTGQTATAQSPPYEAAFPVDALDAPAEPVGVTAVTTDGATHDITREVPVQSLPGWLEFLLEVVSDVAVEFDGEEISISYAPLADLAADLGLPDVAVGGDKNDASGDGAYDLGVGFGGMYNPLTSQADLTVEGDIAADLMQLAFDIGVDLTGNLDTETLELVAATADVDSDLEFDVQPPAVPVPLSIPIPLTSASIGVVPVVVVTADGTFNFGDELGFDDGIVEPGIDLEVELGVTLPDWVPIDGELKGVPSGGIEGSFDVGTDDWNVQATLVLAGEVTVELPLVPSVTLEKDPIWELPVVGGDAAGPDRLPATETVLRHRDRGGPQPLPAVPSVDADDSNVGTDALRETVRLTDRPYEDLAPTVITIDTETQLVVWAQQAADKPAEAGHDIVARRYEGDSWGGPVALTDDDQPNARPVCAATGDGRVLAAWERLDTELAATRLETPADVADLRDQSEIAYSIYDPAAGWSEPTTLTDTQTVERRPTVTAEDGVWLLAWEQQDSATDARTVRSTVVSPDGSTTAITDRSDASAPDTGTRQDGRTDLAYLDWDGDPTGVTHEVLDGETVDQSQQYETSEPLEVVVSNGRVIWVADFGRDPTLVAGTDGTTTPLTLRPAVAEVRELSLTTRDGEAVLSYVARLAERANRTQVYRLDRGDGWIWDRDVTTDEIHDDGAVRVRYTDATLAGPASLLSTHAVREPGTDPVSDVFTTRQTFGPAYAIEGTVDPAPAGTETELNYTLTNRGDVGGNDPVTVRIERDGTEISSTTYDPLDSGESLSATESAVVGETGQFEVITEVSEPSLGTEPTTTAVTAARADLRVTDVTATRTASDEATVAVTVADTGGARTTAVPVMVADAAGPVATETVAEIEPEGTAVATVTVDPTALDTSDTHAVRIDPEGTLPERVRTGDARRTYLVRPGLAVEDVRYRTDDTGPFARVLLSNEGPGAGDGTLKLVDGSGAVVASQRQSVPPAETVDGQRVPVYEQVDLRVPGLSTGDTVTVELVPDVSNLRQEGLNYIDTVETILPGEFDAGTLAPLPGYDNPPRDLDGDGLFEDVDGDGEFTIFDVQAFFLNFEDETVQSNPAAFNFTEEDPEEVSIFDVQALFTKLS